MAAISAGLCPAACPWETICVMASVSAGGAAEAVGVGVGVGVVVGVGVGLGVGKLATPLGELAEVNAELLILLA